MKPVVSSDRLPCTRTTSPSRRPCRAGSASARVSASEQALVLTMLFSPSGSTISREKSVACGRRGRMSWAKPSPARCRSTSSASALSLPSGAQKRDLDAAARGHDRLVQSLAARGARAVAADQRLARLRQVRDGQTQVQPGIADDDDAAWHVTSCLDHDAATSDSPWPLFDHPRRSWR